MSKQAAEERNMVQRRDRLKILLDHARGIKSKTDSEEFPEVLKVFAMKTWFVSENTARDYAKTIINYLESVKR